MMKKKKNKFIYILKIIRKRVKPRTLLLLALTLTANSYAWFIYTTKVNNAVEAHVRSWNVRFDFESSEILEYINFNVDDMYPGMEDYENSIKIINSGEATGKINYEIIRARIIDTVYVNDGETVTTNSIINNFKNNYPFKIIIEVTNEEISPNGGEEQFSIKVKWDYEAGNDEQDTYWGNQAYDYQQTNPDSSIISLEIKISVIQA